MGAGIVAFAAKLHESPAPLLDGGRAPRTPTAIEARINRVADSADAAMVHTLFVGGIRVERRQPFTVGSQVEFDIPNLGNRVARIVWNRADFYGCESLTPLSVDQVWKALANAKLVWRDFGSSGSIPAVIGDGPMEQIPARRGARASTWQHGSPGVGFRWTVIARASTSLVGAIDCWTLILASMFLILK